ncbi:high mobility group protein B1-like isoform X2 [Scleropages formosus]|uniref:high mobility group protein B1-like isoform X2 n=1 Tax=Scleropages formosus TaxID=113540 RepID=UPI0010FA8AA7|nr:high mobility group protein B1-like isoform X2 [Scleropages formosus]
MGLRRRKPDRVPMLTPVCRRKHQQWTRERQNCTMEQCKKSCREEHKKKHPDASINFSEFSKTCSERWKAMSAKEKVKFEDLAKQDKVCYEREMESYVPPKGMKRTKDPSVPKRPPSALFIFCAGHFPKIKSGNPGLSIGDIAKKLGEMWNSTSAEDKQPYEEKAAKLKEKYDKDIAAYHGKGKPAPATVTKAKKSDDEGVHYDEKEGEHYEEEDDDYE